MLQQFVIGSSFPVLLYFFLKVPSIPKSVRNYSFEQYSIIAPIFLGLMNIVSKRIQDVYGLTNDTRFKIIGLLSPLLVFTYAFFSKGYNFSGKQWFFYLLRIVLTHFLIFNIVIRYLENNIFKGENTRKEMLEKLVRQASRWSLAAQQDETPLIAVLHANYGAGYLWAIKDVYSDQEIESVLGSREMRMKFEKQIISIQDKATRDTVKACPEFSGQVSFLSKIAGEG